MIEKAQDVPQLSPTLLKPLLEAALLKLQRVHAISDLGSFEHTFCGQVDEIRLLDLESD